MGTLNLNWVVKNFEKDDFIFFDVGAGNMCVTLELKKLLPNSKCYAFEAAKHYHNENIKCAVNSEINYYPYGVSDVDGDVLFYPSILENGLPHLWSSSMFQLKDSVNHNPTKKEYGDPYLIRSIRLETFCERHNITPDFMHIDVEGAEFKVFKNMGKFKPKCMWAEVKVFGHYDTNTTFEEVNSYLESIGYHMVYTIDADALYCQNDFKITDYIPL